MNIFCGLLGVHGFIYLIFPCLNFALRLGPHKFSSPSKSISKEQTSPWESFNCAVPTRRKALNLIQVVKIRLYMIFFNFWCVLQCVPLSPSNPHIANFHELKEVGGGGEGEGMYCKLFQMMKAHPRRPRGS